MLTRINKIVKIQKIRLVRVLKVIINLPKIIIVEEIECLNIHNSKNINKIWKRIKSQKELNKNLMILVN